MFACGALASCLAFECKHRLAKPRERKVARAAAAACSVIALAAVCAMAFVHALLAALVAFLCISCIYKLAPIALSPSSFI